MEVHCIRLGVTNCWVIKDKSTVLIDAGSRFSGNSFKRKLKKLGISERDLSLLVITHAHFDHSPLTPL